VIQGLTNVMCCAIVNMAVVLCYYCVVVVVMRKSKTPLTYRGDKLTKRYQVLKKIFWGKKTPVRLLYNNVWGTETSPWDEVSYISVCLWETSKILGWNIYKKISDEKNGL
jgi:hypothetical protein